MNGGDLHYHLSQHGVFDEHEMLFYAAEVTLGMIRVLKARVRVRCIALHYPSLLFKFIFPTLSFSDGRSFHNIYSSVNIW